MFNVPDLESNGGNLLSKFILFLTNSPFPVGSR